MHKVRSTYSGQIRYWVLVVSIMVHVIALGVFTGIKMSGRIAEAKAERPSVSMEMIRQAVQEPQPKPKPKVEPIKKPVEQEKKPLIAQEEIPQPEPVIEQTPEIAETEPVESMPAPSLHEVEFFGQKSVVRNVCYVVDCSGSMYGQMYRVRKELKESIDKLNTAQSFSVLFFMGNGQILTTGFGKLKPATSNAKMEANILIDKIRPKGATDAARALEYAFRLTDLKGGKPEVIYFLTDGFNFNEGKSDFFAEKIERLRKTLAPQAVIHTIGFRPQKQDRMMLKTMAQKSGGKYTEPADNLLHEE